MKKNKLPHIASRQPAQEFRHSGEICVNGKNIVWKEVGDQEIVFRYANDSNPAWWRLGDMKFSEYEEANVVNKLLAHYRPHAQPDNQQYYAASAVITDDRIFVAVNNELHNPDPFSGRGCSETQAHRCAQTACGQNVRYDHIYLMSGKADILPSKTLLDKEPRHYGCLCGECRKNVRHHIHENTKFIMLPTNDGSLEIDVAPKSMAINDPRNHGRAWVIDHNVMYPIPEFKKLGDKHYNLMRQQYQRGLETIHQTDSPEHLNLDLSDEAWSQVPRSATNELWQLKHNPSPENINKSLISLVREAYQEHEKTLDSKQNLVITATIVRTKSGKYFPSVSVKGVNEEQVKKGDKDHLSSQPTAMSGALGNAMNTKVDQVYIMRFDLHDVQREVNMAKKAAAFRPARVKRERFKLRYPDPAELGRLIKKTDAGEDAQVTLLPFNSGDLTSEQLVAMSDTFSASKAFGPAFASPKRGAAVGA